MALRVLLADNSETIKKVIQLTLQDFGVEVRSVGLGVDVLDVARAFKPDIIFADILLQKKNGYEVCFEIKNTPELARTPVVLMWSGFMDLDQAKAQQVRADASLEKPFDSNDLRGLIQKFVPKVSEQSLSSFLETPSFAKTDMKLEPPPMAAAPTPPIPMPAPAAPSTPIAMPAPAAPAPTPAAEAPWTMDSFEEIGDFQIQEPAQELKKELPDFNSPADSQEDFAQVPLGKVSLPEPPPAIKAEASKPPKAQPKGQFELDVPDETDFDGVTVNVVMPTEEITNIDFLLRHDELSKTNTATKVIPTTAAPAPTPTPAPQPAAAPAVPQLSEEQLETLLKNQSHEIIEKIVWKLVPDMAERIIREEIKRLLDEPDMKV